MWPQIACIGIYPREVKTDIHVKTWIRVFRAALFIIAQNLEWPSCPSMGKWLKGATYREYISIKTRNGLLIHVKTRMISRELYKVEIVNPTGYRYHLILFIEHSGNDEILEMENKLVVTMIRTARGHQRCVAGTLLYLDLVVDTHAWQNHLELNTRTCTRTHANDDR